RLTNGHGEQCSPLRSRHFVRPAPTPVPPVAAHIVRHKNADPCAAKLVLTTDKPLQSGTVVSILNPEVWQE
ncbi:hypothetical protein, partial [uncultured Subdoligranulum sp.]|uniref:hypothetical protein n=1 Tax=uncultured Subdoligranulum sp. TaxID=512298 RepID=UPI0025EB0C08